MTAALNLLQKVTQALAANLVIKPKEALEELKELVVTVSYLFIGYFNTRITALIDSCAPYEVNYLKFVPLYDEGYLIIMPAQKGEDGAVEFKRSPSGNAGTVNMHGVLLGFDLKFTSGRNQRFTVSTAQTEEEQPRTVLLMRIKKPKRKASAKHTGQQPAPETK